MTTDIVEVVIYYGHYGANQSKRTRLYANQNIINLDSFLDHIDDDILFKSIRKTGYKSIDKLQEDLLKYKSVELYEDNVSHYPYATIVISNPKIYVD